MKSILVIGMGTLGRCLAQNMQELGNDVMVIDQNEELIQELSTIFQDAVTGDCTNPDVLKSIGVNNFDICFVAIGENFYSSLEITSILKELGASRVVSKAKQERQAEFLKKIGADEVFFPEKEIANHLAIRYNSTNIFDYFNVTSDCSIFELPILPQWTGKSIIEINVRQKYHVNIIAIKNDKYAHSMPSGDYRFRADDHIVVIGKSADILALSEQTKS